MKVILGIGNPGRKYRWTRHNAGFRVVDGLADRLGVSGWRSRFSGLVAEATGGGEKLLLVKPETYVNESGRSAVAALDYYRLEPEDMLVVADEAALPLGTIRFNRSGSSAGHKGLESIIVHVGDQFNRLRIGIGGPQGGMVGHVLGGYAGDESDRATEVEKVATGSVEDWVAEGIDECMNRYNGLTIGGTEEEVPEA